MPRCLGLLLFFLALLLSVVLTTACRDPEPSTMQDATSPDAEYSTMDSPAAVQVMFYPRRAAAGPAPPRGENIDVEVAPGVRLGCRFHRTEDMAAPLILFFHGNGEIVPDYDDIAGEYTRRNIHVLLATYRGYGWSGGRPNASSMMADAERLYRFTRQFMKQRGYTGSVWPMGRSLGSACAIELAAAHAEEIGGLIIESGFADTLPLARTLGLSWVENRMTEEDGFRNAVKMRKVTRPTLILHGSHDTLIPPWQAEKLADCSAAPEKSLVLLDGAGHNTMLAVGGSAYFETIRQFMLRER